MPPLILGIAEKAILTKLCITTKVVESVI
ncbi:hypothetical protein AGR13a_Cc210073 [Agrobacterium genomosp. 13 str. CFBP 6927]|uniref:Uncharacterized protein n=1 Tax=Agrobacterium genomosp. 13 str. CFBP 6927 TaxID=1183428 RepID=A0ABM9VD81_9HYPH|nr:hypothetical protein AGR13a_Cc210073 [Agrobacterium genomosp. 13 str. CFBP 6927]